MAKNKENNNDMNPHLSPRTVREWLELIPFDRARKEAIELCNLNKDIITHNLSSAIIGGFDWPTDKVHYWGNIHQSIIRMEQSVKLKNQ